MTLNLPDAPHSQMRGFGASFLHLTQTDLIFAAAAQGSWACSMPHSLRYSRSSSPILKGILQMEQLPPSRTTLIVSIFTELPFYDFSSSFSRWARNCSQVFSARFPLTVYNT